MRLPRRAPDGDEHRPAGPDLAGLRDFIEDRDRRPALHFVGREREIAEIEQACGRALRLARRSQAFEGATRLIVGAPGAGKTALLAHLEQRWTNSRDPEAPIALRVHVTELADPAAIVSQIAGRLAPRKARALRQTASRNLQVGLSAGGVAIGAGKTVTDAPTAAGLGALQQLLPAPEWRRPVCLMVDEIQNLASREQAAMLLAFHEATHGLPVVPLLAGLGNSGEVLDGAGISRLARGSVHWLGPLEPGQPADAVRLMLDHFGIDGAAGETDRWAARLEERSDRWPQHLNGAMAALAEALLAADGALGKVEPDSVLARERAYRVESYEARRSPEMRESRRFLAALMAANPDGKQPDDILADMERLARDRAGWRLPEGMTPGRFFAHLVRKGVLQDGGDGRFACPIPSLGRYLIDKGDSPEFAV